jgi:hypothetical protein
VSDGRFAPGPKVHGCGRFADQSSSPPRPWRERVAELGGLPTSGAGERGSAPVAGHCPRHTLPPLPSSAISLTLASSTTLPRRGGGDGVGRTARPSSSAVELALAAPPSACRHLPRRRERLDVGRAVPHVAFSRSREKVPAGGRGEQQTRPVRRRTRGARTEPPPTCHPCESRDPTRNLRWWPGGSLLSQGRQRRGKRNRQSDLGTYPRSSTPCDSPPRLPSRSEIMTSGWGGGWLGGSGVAPGQAKSTSAWASSLVKPLSTHGASDAGRSREQGHHA